MRNNLKLAYLFAPALLCLLAGASPAYDSQVYSNLQRSRDALIDQKQHLQEQYDETARQLDLLQQKLNRLDTYLRQTQQSLRDVDSALSQTR